MMQCGFYVFAFFSSVALSANIDLTYFVNQLVLVNLRKRIIADNDQYLALSPIHVKNEEAYRKVTFDAAFGRIGDFSSIDLQTKDHNIYVAAPGQIQEFSLKAKFIIRKALIHYDFFALRNCSAVCNDSPDYTFKPDDTALTGTFNIACSLVLEVEAIMYPAGTFCFAALRVVVTRTRATDLGAAGPPLGSCEPMRVRLTQIAGNRNALSSNDFHRLTRDQFTQAVDAAIKRRIYDKITKSFRDFVICDQTSPFIPSALQNKK